jgi:hypothetical protein
MTASGQSGFELRGETVEVSYLTDPTIGQGQFRLENRGGTPAQASVRSVWLQLGDRRQELDSVTVYDIDQEQAIDSQNLTIEAGATLKFLVGFPGIVHEPVFGESTAVGLRVRINGTNLEALSSIKLIRRLPR